MQTHPIENNYIKFLFNKVSLQLIPGESNTVVIKSLLERLGSSDDLVKEIYILSKVKGLRKIAEYLAFILKKLRENKISYENFLLNIEDDSFNLTVLLKNVSFNYSNDNPVTPQQESDSTDTLNFSGSKFKIEAIENELVDDEFQESVKIDEMSETMPSNYKDISTERAEIPEDYFIEEYNQLQTAPDTSIDNKSDKQPKQSSSENREILLNKILIEFENKLFTVNQTLRKDFNILIDKCLLETSNDEEAKTITEKIISSTSKLSSEAEQLSFQLIAKLYNSINEYLSSCRSENLLLNPDKIEKLKKGLDAVESIVNGEDYMQYDDLIKEIETNEEATEKEIIPTSTSEPEVKQQEIPQPKEDEDSRKLRYHILELESIFKRLEDIKGEYKNYEGLRFLSATLGIFKDIIKISQRTNTPKLAQMAEGSYIFIKFLQNYRKDPFDDLSKQIYGYIVYSLKLIYLNKPTKDIDVFISYLNDPVKIYTENKNRTANE